MTEVTKEDIECENNVEWVLHKERVGELPMGEGVKLARAYIARHRQALATAEADIAALRGEVERLRAENRHWRAALGEIGRYNGTDAGHLSCVALQALALTDGASR